MVEKKNVIRFMLQEDHDRAIEAITFATIDSLARVQAMIDMLAMHLRVDPRAFKKTVEANIEEQVLGHITQTYQRFHRAFEHAIQESEGQLSPSPDTSDPTTAGGPPSGTSGSPGVAGQPPRPRPRCGK